MVATPYEHINNTDITLRVSSQEYAQYSLFYRALLQKRRIILRSLLSVATP